MADPEPIHVREISPDDLKARLENGDDLIVVDMRQAWEYQAGHIPGALHMFIQDIPYRFKELPQDTEIVFQCWHGNTSLQASAFLIDNGWSGERIASLSGGIAGWVQAHGMGSLEQA
ncbi:MAG TPA: rhodanese-like domain-containing protein [Anaerolineae bacterium]|nr:rhodanese-like domain-containing protein [Anaerolineae bacterium]